MALVVLDPGLHVRLANPAFYEMFDVGPEETEHHDFFALGSGQWDIPWLRASLVQVLELDSPSGMPRLSTTSPLLDEGRCCSTPGE